MLLLENGSQIIAETLEKKLNAEKPETCNVVGADFDGTTFSIKSVEKKKELINVSIKVNGHEIMEKYGMMDFIKKAYGDLVTETEKGFTVTLQIKADEQDGAKKAQWIKEVPLLKRFVMMSPFAYAFDKFKAKQTFEPIVIPYRDEESIYIVCYENKSLVVVYSIKFRDADDIVLAKVFLQEFKDAKRDRALGNSPSINFSQGVKPAELKGIKSMEPDDVEQLKSYGFVSMILFERHVDDKNRLGTLDKLIQFRNYLHYHLKCSKAYMHFRMRDRVVLLLQNLEAAKDKTGKKKEMKTASGRRFEKKV